MNTQPERIHVSREWLNFAAKAVAHEGRYLVVGGCDTGKSIFCRWLAHKLNAQAPTAIVDADVGQSTIGPPATVGWKMVAANTEEFVFVGNVSPVPHLLQSATGTARMARRAARAGARFTVIDTTGFITGLQAVALKTAKIDLLAPLHLVVMGDSIEIRRLLVACRGDERVTVHQLPVTDHITNKTMEQRAENRRTRFTRYLQDAQLQTVSLRNMAISGLPAASDLKASGRTWSDLKGSLLCFHDTKRLGTCIGLLHSIDIHDHSMLVLAPAAAASSHGFIVGTLRLLPDCTPIDAAKPDGRKDSVICPNS